MSHQRRLYDDDAMCAGEQERQKVKKEKSKTRHNKHLYGNTPLLNVQISNLA